MVNKPYRVLTYGKTKPMVQLHNSDHKSSRVKLKYLLFYKVYTTRLGRVVTQGDKKPPMKSHDSVTMQSCEIT